VVGVLGDESGEAKAAKVDISQLRWKKRIDDHFQMKVWQSILVGKTQVWSGLILGILELSRLENLSGMSQTVTC